METQNKKTVLVTGASGLLGSHVVKELATRDCNIIVSILPFEADTYKASCGERVIFNQDIFDANLPHIDSVINCAFARSNNLEHLASAFEFTESLINGFQKSDIEGIINISSQGVYKRLPVGEYSREDSPIEPIDTYSVCKFACEKLFAVAGLKHVTSVRLASINMKQRFLYKFVEAVKAGNPIALNSPNVYASILDVKDAASALASLALLPAEKWAPVYNLGTGKQYSLKEYAEAVKSVGEKLGYNPSIELDDNGNASSAGMDVSLLMEATGWKPAISLPAMIEEMFNW